jgi:hypothetical protein
VERATKKEEKGKDNIRAKKEQLKTSNEISI